MTDNKALIERARQDAKVLTKHAWNTKNVLTHDLLHRASKTVREFADALEKALERIKELEARDGS